MNDTLDSYHTKEDKRRSAERGIGVTIFVLWVALLVFSILALVLYGAFFGSSVNSKGYGGDNGLLNYMLGLSGAKTSRSLQGGYFIMIIVVVIAIVMVILTACCPCTQGIYVCGRDGPVVDDKVFKATEESANTRTTGREEYYSPPQSVQKPRYDDSPTKKPTYNYDVPPNNNIQVNTNHNNGYPDAAYGVPLALPGPQLPPGATPEDIQRSYQALGLPDPNYKGKSVS
ncbi:hypothetical protein ADEAN_000912800 [Angomonas deanei]|uniref:Uncharacterized protein n=1 Tax=Angomonas deanei TaxID=59799 RepID=A0A7G2CP08_9TRYP|nr:hypothetical protein ADEAN_000912800 [Angomonas deanei]